MDGTLPPRRVRLRADMEGGKDNSRFRGDEVIGRSEEKGWRLGLMCYSCCRRLTVAGSDMLASEQVVNGRLTKMLKRHV